jgi:hypothetical protein
LFANGFLFESSQPAQAGAKAKEKKPLQRMSFLVVC